MKLFGKRRYVWVYGNDDVGKTKIAGPYASIEEAESKAFHQFPGEYKMVRLETVRKSKAKDHINGLIAQGFAEVEELMSPEEVS